MSDDNTTNLPDQKELEKEIGDYLSKKYGDKIKIVTTGLFPQTQEQQTGEKARAAQSSETYTDFDLKPEELVAYLDEYVIQQADAKAVLATKICTHFNRIRYCKEHKKESGREFGRIKNNILLIGPTGVGKTYLVKLIAHKIGVPFVKGDATKFSETGYVGGDVEDLVRDLVREADGDIDKAQYGIIYVDEVDKIARSPHRIGADVSRSGVQRALLKPMEETEVELKVPHDIISQMEAMEAFRSTGKRERRSINTKNILFIMSGSFDGLDEIISKRCDRKTIGFEGNISTKHSAGSCEQVKAEDLVQFGFESEFVGRLPIIAILDRLTEEDFYQILLSPNCPVVLAKKQDFLAYGIKLTFTDAALRLIAQKSAKEKTGARGLVSVVEKVLMPFEKKLPSTEITSLSVTVEMVGAPEKELERLLNSTDVQREHQQRCLELEQDELVRLVKYIKNSRTLFMLSKDISVTDAKLGFLADMCHKENIDIAEACKYFVGLINHIKEWEGKISEKCGLKVNFEEGAIDYILGSLPRSIEKIDTVCDKVMTSLEYGLRLMTHKKHIESVVIPAEGVENPEQFINELVEKAFKE